MRCKFISDARCKNKATDKYQGVAVCAGHKRFLEERVKTVLGSKDAAQQMCEPDVMPCGHPLAEAYQGEDSGTYCRICESA